MKFYISGKGVYRNLVYKEAYGDGWLDNLCRMMRVPYDFKKGTFVLTDDEYSRMETVVERLKRIDSLILEIEDRHGFCEQVAEFSDIPYDPVVPFDPVKHLDEMEAAIRRRYPEFFDATPCPL